MIHRQKTLQLSLSENLEKVNIKKKNPTFGSTSATAQLYFFLRLVSLDTAYGPGKKNSKWGGQMNIILSKS